MHVLASFKIHGMAREKAEKNLLEREGAMAEFLKTMNKSYKIGLLTFFI
jgi:hypothetical protein